MAKKELLFKDSSVKDFNVVISGKYKIVNAGLRQIIHEMGFNGSIRMAKNGRDIMELHQEHPINVAILCIENQDKTERKMVAQIIRELPEIRLIVMGFNEDRETMEHWYKGGVNGYLNIDADETTVMQALLTVRSDLPYFQELNLADYEAQNQRVNTYVDLDHIKIKMDADDVHIILRKQQGDSDVQAGKGINQNLRFVQKRLEIMRSKTDTHTTTELLNYLVKEHYIKPIS